MITPADGLVLHDREDDVSEVGQQFRGREHGEPYHRAAHQRFDGALGEHGEHEHDQGRNHAGESIDVHGYGLSDGAGRLLTFMGTGI